MFAALNDGDAIVYERACAVRPIVTLNSNVQLDTSDAIKDGSEEAKAWILK